MKQKVVIVFLVLIGMIGSSILFGPTLFYKPLSSNTEYDFVFDYVENDDESNYATLGVSIYLKLIEKQGVDVIEIHYFDSIILEQIVQDYHDLIDVLERVNFDVPSDLSIIERDDSLELVIHARFNNRLFYQTERIFVSKYFNLILPVIGGISLSETYIIIQIFGNAGYLAGTLAVAEYGYDTPVVMYYEIYPNDFVNQRTIWDTHNYRLHLGSYGEDGITSSDITKIIIIPESE
jgi:hypothetical protein